MRTSFTKFQVATAVAVFFHLVGLIGILFIHRDFFVQATPYNLLLSLGLLTWTHPTKNVFFLIFIVLVFCIGFAVEAVGVNTGLLFGEYRYGNVLGIKWQQVPLIIGVNWVIVIMCCGITTQTTLEKLSRRIVIEQKEPPPALKALAVIVDGSTVAVLFDWLMEPVAVELGYWTWLGDGEIPGSNFVTWFVVCVVLLALYQFLPFGKQNKFAVNLLLIQGMFFLVLRTMLT